MVIRSLALIPLIGLTVLVTPALAGESQGSTRFQPRFGEIVSSFSQSVDHADGSFSRAGHITLPDGGVIAYALAGTCPRPGAGCDFTGTATGPLGGRWQARGHVVRNDDGVHLTGALTTPDGRLVNFDRVWNRRHRVAPALQP